MKNIYFLIIVSVIILGCKKSATSPEIIDTISTDRNFSNVVILGNSITTAGPDPSIGWNNNWGMAATKPEFDYVHLLTAHLQDVNHECKISVRNIGPFEVNYTAYNYRKDYQYLRDLKPDLVIIRIGENVVQDDINLPKFDEKYLDLLSFFREKNPDVKFLAVGSFWGNPMVDMVMQKYSKFVTLRPLLNDLSNQAFGQFDNYSVAIHPSDKGMKGISDIIWDGLDGL